MLRGLVDQIACYLGTGFTTFDRNQYLYNMANNKHGRIIGASLKLETPSSGIVSENPRGDLISPERRGRLPPELPPLYFKHHDSTSTGSVAEPGGDFGSLSPDAADLVYPIRSVVSISQPLQLKPSSPDTLWGLGNSPAESTAGEAPAEVCAGPEIHSSRSKSPKPLPGETSAALPKMMLEGASKLGSTSGVRNPSNSDENEMTDGSGVIPSGGNQPATSGTGESYVTTRFEHIMTGDGHCVITGVSGSESMQRCEDEPIHIPGAVQGFGVLIALKEDAGGKLSVKIASEVGSQPEQPKYKGHHVDH